MNDEYVYARGSIKCWLESDGEKLGTHAVALIQHVGNELTMAYLCVKLAG